MRCSIVPPYLMARVAPALLDHDTALRDRRAAAAPRVTPPAPGAASGAPWTVYTAGGSQTLPGTRVRAAGDPASGDAAVDEAATGITGALAMYAEVYDRDSYDGKGAPVVLTVHYGTDYDNAFWDGTQLVFGDGDGKVFGRFTRPVDVLGHELTHAVTERTAGLTYQGQSGALNESVSDVFGSCLKQRLLDQTVDQADWLIGAGLFEPGIHGRALRDMAAPGTAYDDPALGKDPQPADMSGYVDTTDDNGGVHINSGIPNRAFQLAATRIGGRSWEGAGRIWYATLTGGRLTPDVDFAGFAAATVAAAGDHADEVRSAWETVGVLSSGAGAGAGAGAATSTGGGASGSGSGSADRRVAVRRTGGFAGLRTAGELDLGGDDPRAPEVASLVERVDLRALTHVGAPPQPDHFVYDFDLCGDSATVPEQHLTDDLRRIADLVLGDR
jgi:hypothetical protein